MDTVKSCLEKLKNAGLKQTPQRSAILEILERNSSHPSANRIYREAKKKFPMISFATVYKTLKVLVDVDEIQQLKIAEGKVNFDPNTEPHNHFYCKRCKEITDIIPDRRMIPKRLNGHLVERCQVYYYGICSNCLSFYE